MKRTLQAMLLALVTIMMPIGAWAYDFEVDGICYKITSTRNKTVGVTFRGETYDDNYSGISCYSFSIPNTVDYNGTEYNVTSIEDKAFAYCYIQSIVIPQGITSIGQYAFRDCFGSAIENLEIPNSVTSIGNYAFNGAKLKNITIPNSVTNIGNSAFSRCSDLISVTLPNSITGIPSGCFNDCWSLTSISIPDGFLSIGSYAFEDCRELNSVSIPNSVTSIGAGAFYGCKKLTYVTIPSNVTEIGDNAFFGCAALKEVIIPSSVNTLGEGAFGSCTGLTDVGIQTKSITNIENGLFYGCSSLTRVVIPKGVIYIDQSAFEGCSNLGSVVIPNSVTQIEFWAFRNCSKLTSVEIPCSVIYIDPSTFEGCSGFESIKVDVNNAQFDSRDNCNAIITTIQNPHLSSIKENTLIVGCKNSVIPDDITTIGAYAFSGRSELKEITIPFSITSIEHDAFNGCVGLSDVYYLGSKAQWENITIGNNNSQLLNATIHYSETSIPEMNIVDGEQTSFTNAEDVEVGTLTYTRTLPNLKWNSLYVPFEIEVTDEFLQNYDVAYANNMHADDTDDNGTIDELKMEVIKIKQGTLHANHPYFIRAKSEAAQELTLTMEDATLYATESVTMTCQSFYTTFALTGIYSAMDADDFAAIEGTHYAISTDGGWWQTEGLNPFRVYMTMTAREGSPVKVSEQALSKVRIFVAGEGDATGIDPTTINDQKPAIVYDLMGRPVAKPKKDGIYIVNGKKMMVK